MSRRDDIIVTCALIGAILCIAAGAALLSLPAGLISLGVLVLGALWRLGA